MIMPEQQPKQETKTTLPTEEKPDIIPPQYKDMPSEVVEELWQNTVYADAAKNKTETARRQAAIEAIKRDELAREAGKEKQINERFSKLPDDQKNEFSNAQKDAVKVLTEHIQGQRDIDGLSPEEFFVLGKLKTAYEEFKKENPDKPFNSDFLQGIDNKIYENLAQRLTFKVLEGKQNIIDQEKANALRQGLGIPTQEIKNPDILPRKEGFDIENLQKSEEKQKMITEIKPIDIIQINENIGIERRKINPQNISFKQDGESTKVLYSGQEWYSVKGRLVEKNIGNKKIRIIVSNDSSVPHASYESTTDAYIIGPKAKEEFDKDPEMFISSINHEAAHDGYFSLDEKQQKETDDLFLQDAGLQDTLRRFATALYGDKLTIGTETAGQNYLRTHDINNSATRQNTLAPEGQKGLKDARSIVFEIDGKRNEILVGLLVTELISYMSSLEISQNVFDKVAENGRNARGGKDPRYDAVQACHDYIKSNPEISSRLEKLKLLGRNMETERLFMNLFKQ